MRPTVKNLLESVTMSVPEDGDESSCRATIGAETAATFVSDNKTNVRRVHTERITRHYTL